MKAYNRTIYIFAAIIASVIVSFCTILFSQIRKQDVADAHIKTSISNGYTCYLDGEHVDGTKLDLSAYKIEINDEKEEVYITKRESGGTVFFPIFH